MNRRRRSKPSGGVQMFSFLDAMICTMGALLVLLHAFARHGQIEIAQKAEVRASRSDAKAECEEVQWRVTQLKESRAKTEAQLADERLKLAHVEDHERRLRDRFRQLKIAATEMVGLDSKKKQERQQGLAELAATQDKVRLAQQAVADARRDAQGRESTYSVVPYDGPHATRRRPIYIECRDNAIVLQPENIELSPADFAGFLGPGNPLASALRGMREYLAQQSSGSKDAGEPYPLLLVRPEGIEAYYAARTALDSWGSEFGYELVGSDWKLKFPDPDPRLAEVTRQAVADARVRQRDYVMNSPQIAKSRPRQTYHARSHGGFTAERGSGGGGSGGRGSTGWDDLGGKWTRRGAGNGNDEPGRGSATGGGGDQLAAGGRGGMGFDGSDGGPEGSNLLDGGDGNAEGRYANGRYGNGNNGGGGAGTDRYGTGRNGGGTNENSGTGYGGDSRDGSAGSGDTRDGRYASNGSRQGRAGGGDSRYDSGAAGNTDDNSSGSSGGASYAQGQYAAGQNGQGSSGSGQAGARTGSQAGGGRSSSTASGSAGGGSDASNSQASLGSAGGQGTDSASASASAGQPPTQFGGAPQKKVSSMAKTRGRDWGLPDSGAPVGASRPILIECHNDRLVILPESNNERAQEVKLGEHAQDSMDEFVSGVWQHMKGWGTAGKGVYWRPTLSMEVKPGAADRYAEIKSLLADSGLDVHERQPHPTATKNPIRKTMRK